MQTSKRAAISAGALAMAFVSGCGPSSVYNEGAPIPDQASACPTTFDEDFPDTRSVAIGEGEPAAFAPYEEGAAVSVIQGNQGAFMMTPTVRVAARSGDEDRACFRVALRNDYQGALSGGSDGADASQSNVRFLREGDFFFSNGALYNIFSHDRDELAGIEVELTVTVQGSGFEGSKTVDIVLK